MVLIIVFLIDKKVNNLIKPILLLVTNIVNNKLKNGVYY